MTRRLRDRYPKFDTLNRIERIEVVRSTPAGRPIRFELVDDEDRSIELEAENFRLAVDSTGRVIRSNHFEVVAKSDEIILTDGRGFGHGVGLCQYGAHGLAKAGWDAERMLRHYYPSSHLTRAY